MTYLIGERLGVSSSTALLSIPRPRTPEPLVESNAIDPACAAPGTATELAAAQATVAAMVAQCRRTVICEQLSAALARQDLTEVAYRQAQLEALPLEPGETAEDRAAEQRHLTPAYYREAANTSTERQLKGLASCVVRLQAGSKPYNPADTKLSYLTTDTGSGLAALGVRLEQTENGLTLTGRTDATAFTHANLTQRYYMPRVFDDLKSIALTPGYHFLTAGSPANHDVDTAIQELQTMLAKGLHARLHTTLLERCLDRTAQRLRAYGYVILRVEGTPRQYEPPVNPTTADDYEILPLPPRPRAADGYVPDSPPPMGRLERVFRWLSGRKRRPVYAGESTDVAS